MTFAKRLKQLRATKNISQAALADILGVTQQAVGKWECDKATPDYTILINIAKYFNVSIDYMLKTSSLSEVTGKNTALSDAITPEELQLIKNYRKLDKRGKRAVNYTLNNELEPND